jgi:hypothetical protein
MKIGELVECTYYNGFGIVLKKLSYEERSNDPWPLYECYFCIMDSENVILSKIMKFREHNLFLVSNNE